MKILSQNQLSLKQLNEIHLLNNFYPYYEPYLEYESPTGLNCFFMCYETEQETNLTGFLSCLVLSEKKEAEITAMTHKNYQNQGIFTSLLNAAGKEMNQHGIFHLYGNLPEKLISTSVCKEYSHTEYLLALNHADTNQIISNNPVLVKSKYNNLSFSFKEDTYTMYIETALKRLKIGICHLAKEIAFTNIWGVEIKKPYRNQGYGSELIRYVICDYFKTNQNPLILHVSDTNIAAFRLYRNCGFEVAEQIEYHTLHSS